MALGDTIYLDNESFNSKSVLELQVIEFGSNATVISSIANANVPDDVLIVGRIHSSINTSDGTASNGQILISDGDLPWTNSRLATINISFVFSYDIGDYPIDNILIQWLDDVPSTVEMEIYVKYKRR